MTSLAKLLLLVPAVVGPWPIDAGPVQDSESGFGPGYQRRPYFGVLHFQILANRRLPHLDIWRSFLSQAPAGSYRLWLHCRDYESCARQLTHRTLPGLHLVPSVPFLQKWDQISPHVKLLEEALQCQPAIREKFVLLSSKALPVKPFLYVYAELLSQDSSHLCPMRRSSWSLWSFENRTELIPRIHQWMVLNRKQAKRLVARFVPGHMALIPWRNSPRHTHVLLEKPDAASSGQITRNIYYPLLFSLSVSVEQRCKILDFGDSGNMLLAQLAADKESLTTWRRRPGSVSMAFLSVASLGLLRSSSFLFAHGFAESAQLKNFGKVMFDVMDQVQLELPPAATCNRPSAEERPAALHFLFLLRKPISESHRAVWASFFAQAAEAQSQVWCACLAKSSCGGPLTAASRWVPTAPEQGCADSLTPVVQLLKAALQGRSEPADKFVILGDAALPLKPFSEVYKVLVPRKRLLHVSDFCLTESQEWARLQGDFPRELFLVGHSPWLVLSRDDARMLATVWKPTPPGEKASFLFGSRSFREDGAPNITAVELLSNSTCSQDTAAFALLFGLFPPHAARTVIPLSRELRFEPSGSAQRLLSESRCRTLDLNRAASHRFPRKMLLDLEKSGDLGFQEGPEGQSFGSLSPAALQRLRRSSFLFAAPFQRQLSVNFAQILLIDDTQKGS